MINTTLSQQASPVLDVEYQQPSPKNRFESFNEFKEFVETSFIDGSGIDPKLFKHCIEFHEDQEFDYGGEVTTPIHEALNWTFTRFTQQVREPMYAAFFMNEDGTVWQSVLSLWDEDRQRPYIYRAPNGNGDRVYLPPVPPSIRKRIASRYGVEVPTDGSFWKWFETATIPRIIGEGGKKGLAMLSQGYVPLPLYGCKCGGREKLTPDLKRFNQEDAIWLFALDRDSKEKTRHTVNAAKRNLGNVLDRDGFKTYREDIVWSSEDGKGVDDLMVNKGFGAFDSAYNRAIARLEKQFHPGSSGSDSKEQKHKNPPPDQMAKKIAEDYRQLLAFDNETKQWRRYAADFDGVWSNESPEYVESIVYKILGNEGAYNFGPDYVTGVVKILRHELIERQWNQVSSLKFLPFLNGVAEISTGELLPHSPQYRLTWCLPRNYSALAGSWENINTFLEHLAAGNADIKELLICYCNAVIKGRYDLQKFLHLIGLGGTGKGTFTRLLTELIGKQNVLVTNLPIWCTNQFEGANAFGKRLVIFPDEDPYRGTIGRFLSLTGEDQVRAEEKRQKSFNFDYQGMTLVVSNFPVFSGGSSSRAKRRTITVPCNNTVPEAKRQQLSTVFEPELAAFTNYLLSLSDDHVTAVLKGKKEIPECTLEFWNNQMKGDSVAAWINDKVIFDVNALTAIGNDKNEGGNGDQVCTLFGSYNRHCQASGDSPKSVKVFSPDLIELCQTILKWSVQKEHTKTGKFLRGLRLRTSLDEHIPTYDYLLMERVTGQVTDGDGSGDGSGDESEPLPDKAVTDSAEITPKYIEESPENEVHFASERDNPPVPTNDQIDGAATRPTKCRYYQIVKVEPTIFKIETGLGAVSVSAEPYHRFGNGDSKIWFEFKTPDGQTLTKSVKADPDQRLLPRVAKECGVIKKWEGGVIQHFSSKIENSDCKFKVRTVGEDDYEWIEDCILKDVPNPPSSTQFIFKTPKNTVLVSYLGEFEEM
jgi:putative DNA primase/helicase